MGLRNLLRRRQTPATVMPAPSTTSTLHEYESLTSEQRADLQAARVELQQAMEDSYVTSFRACSRDGRPWLEDPDAMRAMAAIFRSVKEDTSDGGTSHT